MWCVSTQFGFIDVGSFNLTFANRVMGLKASMTQDTLLDLGALAQVIHARRRAVMFSNTIRDTLAGRRMTYAFVRAHRAEFGILAMCRTLQVHVSGPIEASGQIASHIPHPRPRAGGREKADAPPGSGGEGQIADLHEGGRPALAMTKGCPLSSKI